MTGEEIPESDEQPASKRIKLEMADSDTLNVNTVPPGKSLELEASNVVSQDAVDIEGTAFLSVLQQKELPQDIMAAWMIRDGQSLPQPPEHPLFSPAPPKLLDPTARSLLGDVKLALNLNKLLQRPSGTIVLKICQALWTLHALTEENSTEAVRELDKSLKHVHEQREANFAMRLATANTGNIMMAVRTNIEQDRLAFQRACEQQREKLQQDVAWRLRRLLCMQQQVLTQLQIPGFSGPTVDAVTLEMQSKVCSYLHAAFFLRNRIGPAPHLALLAAQSKRLEDQVEKEAAAAIAVPPPVMSGPPQQQQQPPAQMYSVGPPPVYPSYGANQQQQVGYGIPQPPPRPHLLYPPYMAQQHLQHNQTPHMTGTTQQPPPPYGSAPYNHYYPPS